MEDHRDRQKPQAPKTSHDAEMKECTNYPAERDVYAPLGVPWWKTRGSLVKLHEPAFKRNVIVTVYRYHFTNLPRAELWSCNTKLAFFDILGVRKITVFEI